TLTVDGAVQRPLLLTLDDLRALPSRSQLALLECAGNGRGGFVPSAEGTQWDVSAVGTAEWTGVSLTTVLERAGIQSNAVELVFQGGENPTFARSLTRAHAMQPEVMLAWAMNGESLPADHGYPLRLVVPGWIGVASVKWLTRIEAVTTPFEGFYQRQRYVLERPDQPIEPATSLPVRAVLARPVANAILTPGP